MRSSEISVVSNLALSHEKLTMSMLMYCRQIDGFCAVLMVSGLQIGADFWQRSTHLCYDLNSLCAVSMRFNLAGPHTKADWHMNLRGKLNPADVCCKRSDRLDMPMGVNCCEVKLVQRLVCPKPALQLGNHSRWQSAFAPPHTPVHSSSARPLARCPLARS